MGSWSVSLSLVCWLDDGFVFRWVGWLVLVVLSMVSQSVSWSVGWSVLQLFGHSLGWPVSQSVGWLVGWSVIQSVSQSAGRSVGRFVSWPIGRSFSQLLVSWMASQLIS